MVVEKEDEEGGTFAVGVSWPYRRPRLLENILKLYIWVPFLCAKQSEVFLVSNAHFLKSKNPFFLSQIYSSIDSIYPLKEKINISGKKISI